MRRRGFTLVELMVVIGIIALIAAAIAPIANRAYATAKRASLRADLEVIANAIDAYQNDYGDIPRPDSHTATPFQGGVILNWALVAPGPAVYSGSSAQKFTGDGADGIGFRVRGTTGKILGPYLPDGKFRFGTLSDSTNPLRVNPPSSGIYDDSATFIGDRDGNAILYYPRKLKVVVTSLNTYFGALSSSPAYVANDNDPGFAVLGVGHPMAGITRTGTGNPWALQQFQLQLPGVIADASGNPTLPDLSKATTLPYLLWDAGPDGQFCTPDDVTNFRD
jgi:prepilin-type N-terminal cleavage/methylation domain-containing protein